MREMGFEIARRHTQKLRSLATALLFVLPFLLFLALLARAGSLAPMLTAGAVLSAAIGVAVERWLFFA